MNSGVKLLLSLLVGVGLGYMVHPKQGEVVEPVPVAKNTYQAGDQVYKVSKATLPPAPERDGSIAPYFQNYLSYVKMVNDKLAAEKRCLHVEKMEPQKEKDHMIDVKGEVRMGYLQQGFCVANPKTDSLVSISMMQDPESTARELLKKKK